MDDHDVPQVDSKIIDKALAHFFESLGKGQVKMIVADALRLLELRKQLAQEEIREVKVKWVEPEAAPFATRT